MTPPNSNKSMRLANLVGLFYTLKALTWQRFGGLTHHEKSEMKRLKPLQIEVENIKVRRFEPHYLIWRSCWSFLPPGKALNSSVCNEVVWYCKTQYRKRHLLEICQNASFLSTPDIKSYRYRCVWRKARRINRFRAFLSPDFFFWTIDFYGGFGATDWIWTGGSHVLDSFQPPAPF